jgi:type IV pilus assembly protein PilY1
MKRRYRIALMLMSWCAEQAIACREVQWPEPFTAVTYGAGANSELRVVIQAEPNGVLRAKNATTGTELWSWGTPSEPLPGALWPHFSDLQILRFDASADGSIDAAQGDAVWLFFGVLYPQVRYYALDISDPARHRLLWSVGDEVLPGLGTVPATPTVARVKIAGVQQNGEHFVVMLSGGYATTAPLGQRLYLLDAQSGELLWSVAADRFAAMQYPFPSRMVAMDLNGDEYTDRFYVLDVAGQLWRFDVWQGAAVAELVTGGVIARLNAQQFFNAPDVALISQRGAAPYLSLAFGSGDRATLADTSTQNHFYVLRDFSPFVQLTQAQYDGYPVVTDNALQRIAVDDAATLISSSAPGWKLILQHGGNSRGEKVLAESTTINGTVLFTSFEPESSPDCVLPGIKRVYALDIKQASAVVDLNADARVDSSDRFVQIEQTELPGIVTWLPPPVPEIGQQPPEPTLPARCIIGTTELAACPQIPGKIRTFWQRDFRRP